MARFIIIMDQCCDRNSEKQVFDCSFFQRGDLFAPASCHLAVVVVVGGGGLHVLMTLRAILVGA